MPICLCKNMSWSMLAASWPLTCKSSWINLTGSFERLLARAANISSKRSLFICAILALSGVVASAFSLRNATRDAAISDGVPNFTLENKTPALRTPVMASSKDCPGTSLSGDSWDILVATLSIIDCAFSVIWPSLATIIVSIDWVSALIDAPSSWSKTARRCSALLISGSATSRSEPEKRPVSVSASPMKAFSSSLFIPAIVG